MPDDVGLKEHFNVRFRACREWCDARFRAIEASLDERVRGIERSIEAARVVIDERLRSMNEFRTALNDLVGNLATKAELRSEVKGLRSDIDDIKAWKNQQVGAASQKSVSQVLILAVVGVLLSVASLLVAILR